MIDFNNPFLTQQEKKDILALEVNSDFQKERKQMAKEGMLFSSPSYWVVSFSEFLELTNSSKQLDTFFSGEHQNQKKYFPYFDVLLMEHDRVEAGEWDNFQNCFAPIGFQNVAVIGLNGRLVGEIPKSHHEGNLMVECVKGEMADNIIKDYEANALMYETGIPFIGIDIWDIPIKELDKYEKSRIHKRTYSFSEVFETLFKKRMKEIKEHFLKQNRKKAVIKVKCFNPLSKKSKKSKK